MAWAFIATSGDRRGANLGLRWSDIDFDAGTASLTWTVTCVNHKIVVKPYGKTGDGHAIMLDEGTLAILRYWRSLQNQERLILGFSHVCAPAEPGCGREFKRAQARYNRDNPEAQLSEISLHALRHGWATVALEAGVPMKVVQDRLNHASDRITADIYTHVRAPMQSDAAGRVANMLLPLTPTEVEAKSGVIGTD